MRLSSQFVSRFILSGGQMWIYWIKLWFFFRVPHSDCLNWKTYRTRWSFFTFITTAVQIWIVSYKLLKSFHSSPEDMNSINWLGSQCVASYLSKYSIAPIFRRGHKFESRCSPDFFKIRFRLLNLENSLRWSFLCSLSSTTAVQNMNYFILLYELFVRISTGFLFGSLFVTSES